MPDISGSTILVTGGSGLVGSHTVDQLLKEDVKKVIVFDKVINERNLDQARKSKKIKIVLEIYHKISDFQSLLLSQGNK